MQSQPQLAVSSTIDNQQSINIGRELAEKLILPFCYPLPDCDSQLVLAYTPHGLQLLDNSKNRKTTTVLLFVDFIKGKNGYRLINDRSTKQPLARAVGIKPGFRPRIFDTTAGLGGDSFVLASLGCHVTMSERSQIIAALLEDGLKRAAHNPITSKIVSQNLQLLHSDGGAALNHSKESFHTIYLDPMYPHRKNSALNKQSMRTIRTLVGDDLDAESLFKVAMRKAENRVVVKRPEKAPLISKTQPSHAITMKNSRFDVYLTITR